MQSRVLSLTDNKSAFADFGPGWVLRPQMRRIPEGVGAVRQTAAFSFGEFTRSTTLRHMMPMTVSMGSK